MSERIVRVRVTAGARKESVEEKRGVLHIAVKEKAKDGRANARVRQLVARHCGVRESAVRIRSGRTSPSKTFSIHS